jgi:3-isopropylmalate dehydrogenase
MLADLANGVVIDDRVARDTMIITRETSEKVANFAFALARRRKAKGSRGAVTCVDKADVLKSLTFFRSVFSERAKGFPDIRAEYAYVDAMAMNLVRAPWNYDVLVTENLLGDILSDLGAALVGGMGMAPSADIGDEHAVFQPSHGTAPDIAGKNRANPTAMILSAALMFEWLAERTSLEDCRRAASAIERAVETVYREQRIRPFEFGGSDTTTAIAAAVSQALLEAA